jgi:hypothetical protein
VTTDWPESVGAVQMRLTALLAAVPLTAVGAAGEPVVYEMTTEPGALLSE